MVSTVCLFCSGRRDTMFSLFLLAGGVVLRTYAKFGRSVCSVWLNMLILEGLCGLCDSMW